MDGVLRILVLRLVESSRVLLEDEVREALLRREQRSIHDRCRILYSELFATLNRSRCEKFLVVIPYGGGASLAVTVLLLDVSGVWRTEQLKEVQFKLPGVKFAKDQVDIVRALNILLLEHYHAVKELHVRAPPRDSLQAFFGVADLGEELQPLVSLGLWLAEFFTRQLLRIRGIILHRVGVSEILFLRI